ncbi:MAG TPA: TorF family putative porin [Beijerinckiaceae bacterium]|nr:TorF family putative porin [Beijerinckiaceae bacterium]
MTMTAPKNSLFRPVLLASALLAAGTATGADLEKSKKAMPPVAPAAAPAWDMTFGARIVSDYNFRGISQTNRKPGVQGYAELTYQWLYAGIAGYSVDLPTKPLAEIDFTYGIRPKVGPFTFDIGMIHYYYPREKQYVDGFGAIWTPKNTDFYEIAGKALYSWEDKVFIGANLFHSPNWLGTGATGTYYSGTLKVVPPLPIEGLAVSGELGRYALGKTSAYLGGLDLKDYTYWNAGVSYTYKAATLDLRYHDTDLSKANCFLNTSDPRGIVSGSGQSKWCGAAFIATLSLDLSASGLGLIK